MTMPQQNAPPTNLARISHRCNYRSIVVMALPVWSKWAIRNETGL